MKGAEKTSGGGAVLWSGIQDAARLCEIVAFFFVCSAARTESCLCLVERIVLILKPCLEFYHFLFHTLNELPQNMIINPG